MNYEPPPVAIFRLNRAIGWERIEEIRHLTYWGIQEDRHRWELRTETGADGLVGRSTLEFYVENPDWKDITLEWIMEGPLW